uniref:Chromo domain-containing protein n=1 Tax=Parastrongyloides trichosuri TaxID=131310 RepID=A0A0N5A3U1_PARTI
MLENNNILSLGPLYLVERIIRKKVVNNVNLYRIKWLYYSSAHNTWEPEENISPILVREFEEHLERKRLASIRRERRNGNIVRILDKKMRGCIPFYYVQYKHNPRNKWVTSRHIKNKKMLKNFEKRHATGQEIKNEISLRSGRKVQFT